MPKNARAPDPLRFLPSAAAIRRRLAELTDEVRRLRILLSTAERVERAKADPTMADRRQGGAR